MRASLLLLAAFALIVLPVLGFAQANQDGNAGNYAPGSTYVHGYYTRTGLYVHGHFRKKPLHPPAKHYGRPRKPDAYQRMRRSMQWDRVQKRSTKTPRRSKPRGMPHFTPPTAPKFIPPLPPLGQYSGQ